MKILSYFLDGLREISPKKNIHSLLSNLKGDILAGITVGIIALPLALAFGEISQLGPIAGIWGAIAGGIIGGLFGGCLVGVSGPTAPKAAQIAAYMSFFVVGTTNEPDFIAAFSIIFLSGLILVLISLLRISHLIHYTPYPVMAGFMCGIGALVILTQLNAFIGLSVEKNIPDVFKNLNYSINNFHAEALYVSLPSLIILFLWPKISNTSKTLSKIPSPFIALIIGTCIAQFFNLDIPYIGDKMGSDMTNKVFSLYVPDFNRTLEFIGPAFALAGLAILDSLLSCKVADNITGKRHSSDRETFGQGMANMAAGLFGGVTTATATMRTVANIKFGAKTPMASIVHGLTLLAFLLGLSSFVAAIPTACLAAILFKVGIEILDYRILPLLKKLPIKDLLIFSVVLFVTVYQDLMIAIFIGITFAIITSSKELINIIKTKMVHKFYQIGNSSFDLGLTIKNTEDLSIHVFVPKGPLFFGSVEPLRNDFNLIPKTETIIIDMREVTMIDITGLFSLEDIIKSSNSNGTKVIVSNATKAVKDTLIKLEFIKRIGNENYYESIDNDILEITKNYDSKLFL